MNTVGIEYIKGGIASKDSPSIDAFGRWRVSNPQTLFDSKNINDDPDLLSDVENQPLFYDNQQLSGSGTGTSYNANKSEQVLSVSASTAGVRVRQTKMRFNYQPLKSQMVALTYNFNGSASGITKREGIFDDNNGIFLESNGDNLYFVIRSKATGTVVDNKIEQANWNVDKFDGTGESKVVLDLNRVQILFIDYEWLGVGRVRIGFVIDGIVIYAHYFNHANIEDYVYMQTPNLPLRSEIINDGTGTENLTMSQICSSVVSEGGSEDLGVIRSADTNGTHLDADVENTEYALIGIKLKDNYLSTTIKLLSIALQIHTSSSKLIWRLKLNPTIAGTFTYNDESQSAIKLAKGATANTVTSGYEIESGFIESGGAQSGNVGSTSKGIDTALRLGSLIDGTSDSIVLTVTPIAGSTNVDVEGSITWRELT